MNPSNPPSSSGDGLQFEQAELQNQAATSTNCAVCQSSIPDVYFNINGNVACASCKEQLEKQLNAGFSFRRLIKAAAFGLLGGAIGAGIWYGVAKLTGYELGLIAIAVGWLVGTGVRKGSQGTGGLVYQLLAILITYSSIVSTYIPDLYTELNSKHPISIQEEAALTSTNTLSETQPVSFVPATTESSSGDKSDDPESIQTVKLSDASSSPASSETLAETENSSSFPAPVRLLLMGVVLFFIALVAPFLAGFQNIIGLLIIGFAVYQAWAMNKKTQLNITGPFELGKPGTAGHTSNISG